jgi:hypothetical protein
MAVSKPRNRILIFRLTQEEYEALQSASQGSRSLSEFARSKLFAALESPPVETRLTELQSKVARIEQLLERN